MSSFEDFLTDRLLSISTKGVLRDLLVSKATLIDLCSNDYLGLARSRELYERIHGAERDLNDLLQNCRRKNLVGSTGSRLLTGNSDLCEETERHVAEFLKGEAALIFSSGYSANLGLLSSLVGREDVVIFDEYVHASIRDGIRLSGATGWKFRHNDLNSLHDRLKRGTNRGRIFVVVESIYSMDGDRAPLKSIVELCEMFGAACIVDEAHGTGIFGDRGEGVVVEEGLAQRVAARIHTFGKAVGVHGAAVVGSSMLRKFLINSARSFIYSTAPSNNFFIAIREAFFFINQQSADLTSKFDLRRSRLRSNIEHMKVLLGELGVQWHAESPILPVIIEGNAEVCNRAAEAQRGGYHVLPIRSPTVPVGRERIRLCLHEFDDLNHYREVLRYLIGS